MKGKYCLVTLCTSALILSQTSGSSLYYAVNATGLIDNSTVLTAPDLYIAGNGSTERGSWVNGKTWDASDESNKMIFNEEELLYSITYENVPAGEGYEFKFTQNGSWDVSYGYSSTTDITLNQWHDIGTSEGTDSNIKFDLTVDSDLTIEWDINTSKFMVSAVPVETDPIDNEIISQGQYIRMGSYKGEDVDWFCYKINATGTMMLSKYVLKNSSFGSNSTYTQSNIYKWLDSDANGTFESDLGLTEAEKSIVRTVDLSSTYGDGTDRFIIPAYGNNELNKGSVNPITQYIYNKNTTADIVWLRTPRDSSNARVVRSGDVNVSARYSGVGYGRSVRPMFYLDNDAFKNMSITGSGTEDDPYILEKRFNIATDISPTGGGTLSATAIRNDSEIYSGELPNKLVSGATVTLTVNPNTGYDLESINTDNGTVDLTENQDGTYSFVMPQNDIVISAVFKKQTFTVKWNNYDGSALETDENVEYGTTPTYNSETPKKSYDGQHYYLFSGWSPTINTVKANITYTAQFVTNDPAYTITIPATVSVDSGTAAFEATGVTLPEDKKISITIDGSNTESGETTFKAMNNAKDSTVNYTINNGTADIADGDTVLVFDANGTKTLTLTKKSDPIYAGTHTETLTFGISVE